MSDDWAVVENGLCPNYPSLTAHEDALDALARLRERGAQWKATAVDLEKRYFAAEARIAQLMEALKRTPEACQAIVLASLSEFDRRALVDEEEK